jgi:hypothetical protein
LRSPTFFPNGIAIAKVRERGIGDVIVDPPDRRFNGSGAFGCACGAVGRRAFVAAPPAAARADSAATAPLRPVQSALSPTAAAAVNTEGRTVEQWITGVHAALAITPEEETQWNSLVQAMRENPAAVQKLASGKIDQVPPGIISAFETLYDAMPDPQKKVADRFLQSLGRAGATSYCQCVGANRR